jgi:hypothetical protein
MQAQPRTGQQLMYRPHAVQGVEQVMDYDGATVTVSLQYISSEPILGRDM